MTEQQIDSKDGSGSDVDVRWNLTIPMRDGVNLSAILYVPKNQAAPAPTIFTLTPYIAQLHHNRGVYFARRGFPFLSIDVRGRGNSEGVFRPLYSEAQDGFDIVEWIARQTFCNGKVAMWGGSYEAYAQWVTASRSPPHLATIVPAASAYIGEDFPMRCNVPEPYLMQWLTLVAGRALQAQLFFNNELFWGGKFQAWFKSGRPFRELETLFGYDSPAFREWLEHPQRDEYWDQFNPTRQNYADLNLPILTITGIYDADQPGALRHYREHLRSASADARGQHFLVIGPWDHAGTRTPQREFVGIKVGPESLVDLPKLHLEWYEWTLREGVRPAFLRKNVSYYVMEADEWRYADSLEAITSQSHSLYLGSKVNPTDVFHSGSLTSEPTLESHFDHYIYDPEDVSLGELEATVDPESRSDLRMLYAAAGRHLVYHTAPLARDTDIGGFFKLSVWLAINQPDTDFKAALYDIGVDGNGVLLSSDWIRARYRLSLREAHLITTSEPLRYDFERFTFVARRLKQGHRLRLVIGPINSIYSQKNYNTGGIVADESIDDARKVEVRLLHDPLHPSALYVPTLQPQAIEFRPSSGAAARS